ncbi:MAG: Sec-independent protein translocase protein TatB [Acidimicrobiia bacterium]|nr:Sec-independent protein translocase protein TatB [Acidimicrobiia bacterium]MDH5237683.1 Sec-independent protein translocase protein TatB [Acidimicrobiia bacterium]
MGNLGGGEILVILVVALLVLGPSRLPTAARQVGNAVGELKRLSAGFQNEMRAAMDEVSLDTDSTGDDATRSSEAVDTESQRRQRSRKLVTGSSSAEQDGAEEDLGARNGFAESRQSPAGSDRAENLGNGDGADPDPTVDAAGDDAPT